MVTATNSQAILFTQLLEKYEPEVRAAFFASVADLQSHVDWSLLLDRLEAGDIEGAIAALNISNDAWNQYSLSLTNIFALAGAATVAQVVRTGVAPMSTRFSMDSWRINNWVSQQIQERINGFTNEALQTARNTIQEGFANSSAARTIAYDLAGRPAGSGSRVGGFLGLDSQRAARYLRVVIGMRTAEGVRSLVTKHLDGTLSVNYQVNAATAARILRAYEAGTAVPSTERIISERQYKDALLKARAATIADTQTANAVMTARHEVWKQLVDFGVVDNRTLIKKWRHRGVTEFYRIFHKAMSGKTVIGVDTPFVFGDGSRLLYPHDPMASAKHVINCECQVEYSIDLTRLTNG